MALRNPQLATVPLDQSRVLSPVWCRCPVPLMPQCKLGIIGMGGDRNTQLSDCLVVGVSPHYFHNNPSGKVLSPSEVKGLGSAK